MTRCRNFMGYSQDTGAKENTRRDWYPYAHFAREGRPALVEEADGDQPRTNHGHDEPLLWFGLSSLPVLFTPLQRRITRALFEPNVALVQDGCERRRDEETDGDRDESEANLARVQTEGLVDERVRFKVAEEDDVDHCHVQRDEEDNWFICAIYQNVSAL